MRSFYCHLNKGEKMGPLPVLSIIHTITIGTMLNFNGGNNGHWLENVMRQQILKDNKVEVWRILWKGGRPSNYLSLTLT